MKIRGSTGLYVHVPFCLSRCDYCGFYSTVPVSGSVDAYLVRLAEEAVAARVGGPEAVDTVFVGGGNPTAIGLTGITRLLEIIRPFYAAKPPVEMTFETNPETLTSEIVDLLADLPGIRLSIGVQRLADSELVLLGRHARLDAVYRSLDLACARIENIGIDLILGVPGCPSLAAAAAALLQRFDLKHVSAYFLTVEANTPLHRRIEAKELPDPSEIGPEELFELRAVLLAAGFEHYEISNYARPGRRCRHNLGYWHADDYIGIGPSAVSCRNGLRLTAPADLQRWLHSCQPQQELLSAIDRRNEFLMLSLRLLSDGLDLAQLTARFGAQPTEFFAELEHQIIQGNLEKNGECVRLTDRGLAIADHVMASLFV